MRFTPEEAEDRREFFRAAGRYTLLAVFGTMAALAGRPVLSGQRCVNLGICSSCRAFADCGLPAARSAKRAKMKGAA
jgi:hypothetical protein